MILIKFGQYINEMMAVAVKKIQVTFSYNLTKR